MFVAAIAAIFIGLSLGLFGSGGAILTVPTLIYVLQLEPKTAILGSLLIVATIAFFNVIPHFVKGRVSVRHLLIFSLTGSLGSYLGAILASSMASWLQMIIFALLMVMAAIKMIRTQSANKTNEPHMAIMLIVALAVGLATGLVGVGGGFLLVPALMLFAGLSLAQATATSLALIVIQSLVSMLGYYHRSPELFSELPFNAIVTISFVGIIGGAFGSYLGRRFASELLTKVFGWLLIIIAVIILYDRVFSLG